MSLPENKKVKLDWVNYAKAIAIILIVFRHTLTGMESSGIKVNESFVLINEAVLSFRIPLFMMLSGLFFSKSFYKRTLGIFLVNKTYTVLYPYVLWASIQLSIQIVLSSYTNFKKGWSDFVFLITNPRALDQFWFLYALFVITAVHAILVHFVKAPKWSFLLAVVLLFGISPLVEHNDFLFLFSRFYIFFVLGDIIAELLLSRKPPLTWPSGKVLLVSLPFFIAIQWYWLVAPNNVVLDLFTAIYGAFFIVNLSYTLQKTVAFRWLLLAGEHSLPIFLVHVLVIAAVRIFFYKILHIDNASVIIVVSVLLGIVIPIVFYRVLMRNGVWWVFSLQNPDKRNVRAIS